MTTIEGEGGRDGTMTTGTIEDVEDLVLGITGTTIRGKGRPVLTEIVESIGGEGLHPRMRTRTALPLLNLPTSNL